MQPDDAPENLCLQVKTLLAFLPHPVFVFAFILFHVFSSSPPGDGLLAQKALMRYP